MSNELVTTSTVKVAFDAAHLEIENYNDLKDMVQAYSDMYSSLIFEEDDKKGLVQARSDLLALYNALDTERKNVKQVYNKPLEDFEGKMKYLQELINEPLNTVRDGIKAIDDAQKELRAELLDELIAEMLADEPFDSIVIDDKWLNKGQWTERMQATDKLVASIGYAIKDKRAEYDALEKDKAMIKAYCDAREIDAAGWVNQVGNTDALDLIKQIDDVVAQKQREQAAAQEEELRRKEQEEQEAHPQTPDPSVSDTMQQSHTPRDNPFAQSEPVFSDVIKVTGTKAQLMALNDYLVTSGIKVERYEN